MTIYAYGSENFGHEAAADYLRGLHHAITRLADYPLSAPLYRQIRPAIRALSWRSHHIFYDVEDSRVVIRRILHKAMDVARWL